MTSSAAVMQSVTEKRRALSGVHAAIERWTKGSKEEMKKERKGEGGKGV